MEKQYRLISQSASAYGYPLLVKSLLHTPTLYAPDQEIVYRDRVRLTYREFRARIGRLAAGLKRLGVGPGDTVAVLDWNSHRYLECFFAVPMMGAVLHTVNVRLSPEQMLATMIHAEDAVVLVYEDFLPVLEDFRDKLSGVRAFIVLTDSEAPVETLLPVAGEYEEILSQVDDEFSFPDFPEDVQATLFYTTGTTGEPKGVCFSHRHIVLHTLSVGLAVSGLVGPARFQSSDVYMPFTYMFHVHAWGFPYVATLLATKQVYTGRFDPESMLRLIERERVTFSHGVPTILQLLLDHPLAKEIDLTRWKINTGGMGLPRGLARRAMERGIEIFHGYGMSETCPVLTLANLKPHMTAWDPERQLDFLTKTGFPLPLVELSVVDSAGTRLPRDGISAGEIVVRAPWCTQGYLKDPDRSEALWKDGRLHTGDLAHQDPEGYIHITDRMKDVVKSGGEWISSLDLESLLSRHHAVAEAAVFGVPDQTWGERPAALVVLKEGYAGRTTETDLKAFLLGFVEQGVISKWAVPDRFLFVDEVPKTSTGKFDKKLIRAQFAAHNERI